MTRSPKTAGILMALTALLICGRGDALAGKNHLGQKVEQQVTLLWSYFPGTTTCTIANFGFAELAADGTLGSTVFEIPPGYALEVTDVDWLTTGAFSANQLAGFDLYFEGPTFSRVFSRGEYVTAAMSASQLWRGSAAMTTGFLWKSGAKICVSANTQTASSGLAMSVRDVTLRGYLIKSK